MTTTDADRTMITMITGAEEDNAGSDLAAAQAVILNLQIALKSARTIGMAIGILMATHRISEDEAFGLLARASQHENRKLRDIADQVTLTGMLAPPRQPGTHGRRRSSPPAPRHRRPLPPAP